MNRKKAILITGSSSGIGKATALHLDALGYTVYAGIRKEEDGQLLQQEASDRLIPIILDVADATSIAAAAERIAGESDGALFGLVNNAGIGRGGALETMAIDEIRMLFEINVIGLLAVTKAFIPMLQKAEGKLVNIGSTASFMAFPGAGAYSGSKFAVRAITDSLRLELKPFGVSVVLVAPGAVESRIWEKGEAYIKQMRENLDPQIAEKYQSLRAFGDKLRAELKKIPAKEVAGVIEIALTAAKPKAYYMVGSDAKGAAKAAKFPKRLLDWMILKKIEQHS
jgi:NAD(P)-dependent dehydrogenase (short-subunit alcohol dehydrogenase family)